MRDEFGENQLQVGAELIDGGVLGVAARRAAVAAQVVGDHANPVAEPIDDRAALEQQVVTVLAEAVHQHHRERRVERAVLLVVEAHPVAGAHEAGAVRFGGGELVEHGLGARGAHAAVGDDRRADRGDTGGRGSRPDAAALAPVHALSPR